MKERINFVLEWERRWNQAQGRKVDMAELRFRDVAHDLYAIEEKSRRPHTNPTAISAEPGVEWLSTTSIGNILRRRGLCRPRKMRRRRPPDTQPLAPNDTRYTDFKGKFRKQDGPTQVESFTDRKRGIPSASLRESEDIADKGKCLGSDGRDEGANRLRGVGAPQQRASSAGAGAPRTAAHRETTGTASTS